MHGHLLCIVYNNDGLHLNAELQVQKQILEAHDSTSVILFLAVGHIACNFNKQGSFGQTASASTA
jgi:hypothetical protein